MRSCLLCLFLLAGLIVADQANARFTWAVDEVENPGVPVLQPQEVIDLTSHGPVSDVALSTDGKTLLFADSGSATNIWALLVAYSIRALPFLIGLIVVWRLFALIRTRRRLPIENGPYCRKCAYPTRGLSSSDCPECGKSLVGGGTARGISKRYAVRWSFVTLSVGVLLGVGATYLDASPYSTVGKWLTWRSEPLSDWVEQNQVVTLYPYHCDTARIHEVEIAAGSQPRKIGDVVVSEDGFSIIIPNSPFPPSHEQFITSEDQQFALMQTHDFYAILDLESKQITQRGSREKIRDPYQLYENRSVETSGDVHFSDWLYERHRLDASGAVEYSFRGAQYTEIPLRVRYGYRGRPNDFRSAMVEIERGSDDGQPFHRLSRIHDCTVICRFKAGYLTLISQHGVLIYDLESDQWVAELDIRPYITYLDTDGIQLAVSADRRTVALVGEDPTKVLIYRLP